MTVVIALVTLLFTCSHPLLQSTLIFFGLLQVNMAQALVRLGQIGMGLGLVGTVINSALFNGKSLS